MQNAIIIGAQNVGFSLVRSLKDKGIRLMVLATDPYDFAQYSRFVQEWRRVPSPATSSKAFMAWLLHSASRWEGALLLPSSDAALLSLCRNRHLILQHYRAALPDLEPLENLIHKGRLYRLAQELHLPVPRFHQPGSLEELRQLRPHLQFPCLLKPCESSLFFANFQCKLFRLETFEELENAWTKAQNHSLETIICELIPGADDHLFFYASYRTEDGTVTGEVCVQKLRQHPPGFGVGRVARTVPMMDPLRASTQKLLAHCGYRGFSSAEFKKDPRDNSYKLMEINLTESRIIQ